MKFIFLVGTSHHIQRGVGFDTPETVFAAFRADLESVISRHSINGVAEEMNLDGLGILPSGGSLPFFLARDLGLPHLYCDPNREERKQHGIETVEQREQFWLERLDSFGAFPCLFVLGADHVGSFSALLARSGYAPSVVIPDWEP